MTRNQSDPDKKTQPKKTELEPANALTQDNPITVDNSPSDSDVICKKLTTNESPDGLHSKAVHFKSNTSQQNGFQFPLTDWNVWSGNDWQFEFQYSNTTGKGFHLVQPLRFGHVTLAVKKDNCDLYILRRWPDTRPSPHPSEKLAAYDRIFPLSINRSYQISSRIDELGMYLLSIDGLPVLKAEFPPVRESIVDAKLVSNLPPGPVRPLLFLPTAGFGGANLSMKWPPGTGGLIIDDAVAGINSATQIRVIQTAPSGPRPVSEEQLKRGLVAWYPFDDVGNNSVTDVSENGLSVKASGEIIRVPGMIGNAVHLQGETVIPVGQAASFDWNEPFTLCAWIKPSTIKKGMMIAAKVEPSTNRGYALSIRRGTLSAAIVHDRGNGLGYYAGTKSQVDYSSEGAIVPMRWTHVAITYDGSGRRLSGQLYIDGRSTSLSIKQDARLTATIRNSAPLVVGQGFVGSIDDVRIYNRNLSTEEIGFLAAPDASQKNSVE